MDEAVTDDLALKIPKRVRGSDSLGELAEDAGRF
jgi:hypothetical protein